jgi:hypothetical protein
MSVNSNTAIAMIGIDIGKNSFHIVGSTSAVRLRFGRNGRVARWRRDSRTCRPV